MYTPFKTKKYKLSLRPLTIDDAEAYFKLLKENRDHMNHAGIMSETKQRTISEARKNIVDPPNPKKARFGIWRDDALIGMMSLTNKGHKRCEVGGWIGQKYTRQGYAADALRSLCLQALKQYGYNRVIATTYPDNHKSQAWLEKVGFTLTRRYLKRYYFAFQH